MLRSILFGCLVYLISASFTRISYKIIQSSDPFWIVEINANERTEEIPMMIIPYSKDSWFSPEDSDEKNIEALVCDSSTACNILNSNVGDETINYLNYTLKGASANLQAYPNAYTEFFNLTQATKSSIDSFSMKVPLQVVGGLGLGINDNPGETSFLRGFKELDNYIASIYLSQNNFDITSELLIGDYNQAFIEDIGRNFTIPVQDKSQWSLSFSMVADNTGHEYNVSFSEQQPSAILDPNLNYIGIPDSIYSTFLQNFTTNNSLSCSNDTLFPVCQCEDTKVFPLIYFRFGQVNLVFPPDLYVKKEGSNCTLLIGSTKVVKAVSAFQNVWVFGSPVLTYYYTMFDFNSPNYQIIFTKAKIFERNNRWYIILGASAFVVLLAGILAGLSLLKGRKQYQVETLIENEENKKNV